MLFFCFYYYRDLRYLHSFPTRRSSDLKVLTVDGKVAGVVANSRVVAADCSRNNTGIRSEEHTSEFQSPDHLVCRLLLEKKKLRYSQSGRRSALSMHCHRGVHRVPLAAC